MPSIDIILEQPEVVVLGGPSSIQVQLDTGATGQRGTQTYVGAGNPSSSTIPNYSSIIPGDLYINAAPGTNYSWLYQYIVKPGGNTWEPILSMQPALYHAVYQVAYIAGEATVSIPITNITTSTANLTADNFAVGFIFENNYPVAGALKTKQVSAGNLVLTFTAAEFNGTTWAAFVQNPATMFITVRVISGTIML